MSDEMGDKYFQEMIISNEDALPSPQDSPLLTNKAKHILDRIASSERVLISHNRRTTGSSDFM